MSEGTIKSLANCDSIVNRGILLDWYIWFLSLSKKKIQFQFFIFFFRFLRSYDLVGDVQIEDIAR